MAMICHEALAIPDIALRKRNFGNFCEHVGVETTFCKDYSARNQHIYQGRPGRVQGLCGGINPGNGRIDPTMKTVFPNLRVLLYVSLVAAAVLFLLVVQIFSSSDSIQVERKGVVVRDALIRNQVEKNEEYKHLNVDFVDDTNKIDRKISGEVVEDVKKAIDDDIVAGADVKDGVEVVDKDADQTLDASSAKEVIPVPNDADAVKRDQIREMMKFAWAGYKNYSWGANELAPVAKGPHHQNIFGGDKMAATIVDAADTLFIMGLTEEYQDARDFIEKEWSIKKATSSVSVFETTIRFVGGFLALYGQTGEEIFKQKAVETADALLPAFDTDTGIARSLITPGSAHSTNYNWAQSMSILAEFGSLHLEFAYLAHITGNRIYLDKVQKIRDFLDKMDKPNGLYYTYINPSTGRFGNSHVSLGALGDSFYEYLIKSYLLTNKTDVQALKMHTEASEAIQKHMVKESSSGLKFVAELRGTAVENKMGHLACFTPGMFALEAVNEKDPKRKETLMKLAEDLGHTCHESYVRSETRIGPEMFYFNTNDDATSKRSENGYILRPEVIEGFFYLWRLTGNIKYKEWVWDAISSIDKHCKTETGYAGLKNVYDEKAGFDDVQQSFFLAETLKYAYLTFDNDAIPLDKFVFNTEAHPFPIYQPKV